MGKKADVRKKGSRYDKSMAEDLEKEDLSKDEKATAPAKAKTEAVAEESGKKSKGRFHLMFDV